MTERPAMLTAAVAAALGAYGLAAPLEAGAPRVARAASRALSRWRAILMAVAGDDTPALDTNRRAKALFCGAGAMLGFTFLGLPGAPVGAVAGAPLLAVLARGRRARYARRIDAGAAELALALASALSAGHSVRGSLLTAGRALPQPIAREMRRVAVDLTLGVSVFDALAGLRGRSDSRRIESIAGAVDLHRRSGGDLARLMRELAAAFRTRDGALRDARAATAQARFTAILVGAFPPVAAILSELAWPGSVSGAMVLAPTALLLLLAAALFAVGVLLCARTGRV